MKLHLPKALFTAVIAAFAVSQTAWGLSYDPTDSQTSASGDLLWSYSAGTTAGNPTSGTLSGSFSDNGTTTVGSFVRVTDINSTSTAGFTVSFDLLAASADNWRDIFSLYTVNGEKEIQLQKNNNGDIMLYPSSSTVDDVTTLYFGGGSAANGEYKLGALSDLIGKTLTMTFAYDSESNTSAFKTYVNGSLTNTITFSYAESDTVSVGLSDIVFGNNLSSGRAGNSVQVDNVGVWDSAMTAEEVEALIIPTYTYTASLTGTVTAADATWLKDGNAANYSDITSQDSIALTGTAEGATLTFGDALTVDTVNVVAGKVTLDADAELAMRELNIATDSTAVIDGSATAQRVTANGDLVVEANGTLSLAGTDLAFLAKTTGTGTVALNETITVTGSLSSEFAGNIEIAAGKTFYLGKNQDQVHDLSDATVQLNSGSRFEIQGNNSQLKALYAADNSTLYFEDGVGKETSLIAIDEVRVAADKTLTIDNHWEGLFTIKALNAEGDVDIDLDSKMAMVIEGITASGNIDNASELTLGVAGANSILNIGGTITNSGTLTLADSGVTLSVADVDSFTGTFVADEEATLWDVETNSASTTGNGFATKSGYMQVISNTGTLKVGDTEVTDLSTIKVTYGGADATLTADGRLYASSSAVSSNYIVGGTGEHASAILSDIVSLAATTDTTLEGVTLRNGNKLTVDTTPVGVTVDAGETGTSTLDIAANQTLSSADVTLTSGSMKFTGSGTYTMLGGLKGEADSAWTGTVYLEAKDDGSGGNALQSVTDLDLTKYGNENSKIVIKGVKGYLAATMGEVKADIEIQNTSPNGSWAGLDLDNGYKANYTFSGDFSGGGNFVVRKSLVTDAEPTRGMGFTFKGDMSDFTGQLKNAAGYNTYTFSDNATAVNANIQVTDGTMVLNVNNTVDTTIKQILTETNLKLENKGSGTMKVSSLNDASGANISVTATGGNVEIVGYDRVNNQDVVGAGSNTTIASIDVAAGKNVAVTGNLTVTNSLTVDSSNALTVSGSLVLTGATVDLSGLSLDTTTAQDTYVYTLGTATGGITGETDGSINFTGINVDGYTANLVAMAADPTTSATMLLDDSATNNYLVLTLTKDQATPTTLTEVNVSGGSWDAENKVLTLTTNVDDASAIVFGDTLNVVIEDSMWEQFVKDNNIGTLVDVALTDMNGNYIDLNGADDVATSDDVLVTLNGIGTNNVPSNYGTAGGVNGAVVGSYVTAYIPEPTSTTLSLLALAALAVRRRRR